MRLAAALLTDVEMRMQGKQRQRESAASYWSLFQHRAIPCSVRQGMPGACLDLFQSDESVAHIQERYLG